MNRTNICKNIVQSIKDYITVKCIFKFYLARVKEMRTKSWTN